MSNWSEYNESLKQRGSLEIWIDKDVENTWYAKHTGKNGAPQIYDDLVFQLLGQLRAIFHLRLRQLEGFTNSKLATLVLSPAPCCLRVFPKKCLVPNAIYELLPNNL